MPKDKKHHKLNMLDGAAINGAEVLVDQSRKGDADDLVEESLKISTSLEGLQTSEQGRVLDTVADARKCGLEGILSLPQLVVCGDQSAGKSSVLEALTEIPFPRNDNMCTRFATEIILRRGPQDSLTIKIIPDAERNSEEQDRLRGFSEAITDFTQLPTVLETASTLMDIKSPTSDDIDGAAISKDVLCIEIEGPKRPQLTVVDIPGLIRTDTKGVTKADVRMVEEITDQYINQPRTICLPVITASNDYANQGILSKVREADPQGHRTLGIITKPDKTEPGTGGESSFIALAQNKDVFFTLGWHVLRNRKFDEVDFTFEQRNAAEKDFFRKSNFSVLDTESRGITTLRQRLSRLLFDHVQKELPKLRQELDEALENAEEELGNLGVSRSTVEECKEFMSQLILHCYNVTKRAMDGQYGDQFFTKAQDEDFSVSSSVGLRRLRAVMYEMNQLFADMMGTCSAKYELTMSDQGNDDQDGFVIRNTSELRTTKLRPGEPIRLNRECTLHWATQAMKRTRGHELSGNSNPLLVGELFWEQSSGWEKLAKKHLDDMASKCSKFLNILLADDCPVEVRERLWSRHVEVQLKQRKASAMSELKNIIADLRLYPTMYDQSYAKKIHQKRQDRISGQLHRQFAEQTVDVEKAISSLLADKTGMDLGGFGCHEALDSLEALYQLSVTNFVQNVNTQVIERHIVKGLDDIFSPSGYLGKLDANELLSIAAEPQETRMKRSFWQDRIATLELGRDALRSL